MQDDITASPLCWPPGWRRTNQRTYAPFYKRDGHRRLEISVSQALNAVLDELRMMDVSRHRVIVSSNLRLRQDGLPLSGQKEPEDTGVSVWWTEGKGHKVIALDKYNRVADNLWAVAKTIEALRGIERWGSGEILARTFTGFQALAHLPTHEWFTVLGVQRTAGHAEVEEAYRKRRSETHPDKLEGSKVAFQEVQDAWQAYRKERGLE